MTRYQGNPTPNWKKYQPDLSSGRPKPRPKPKPWSHQHELTRLVGKRVEVGMLGEASVGGILLAADQFTIKIQHSDGSYSVKFKSAMTYFKEMK